MVDDSLQCGGTQVSYARQLFQKNFFDKGSSRSRPTWACVWQPGSDKTTPTHGLGACITRRGVLPPLGETARARAQTVGRQRLANARGEPGKTGANRAAGGTRGGAGAGRLAKEPGGPAPSVEISRKPRRAWKRRLRTRGGRARAFCCVTSRRPASPPLARTHAPSPSSRPFSYTFLLSRAEGAALRAVHSGHRGRARRRRRLRGARRGRDRAETAGVAAGEESTRLPPPARPAHPFAWPSAPFTMQPASAKWYDRRDYVFIEFCVEDSKDVNVNFEKSKLTFSCLGGSDNFKHLNEIDLFHCIDPNDSKHKRTDRSILCCLRKGESGQSWPRLTKERAKLNWLSVDFNNWKDWEDDSDEDMSNFDRFSEMMDHMGGDEDVDLPEVDGADDDSQDSDDEKMPDLE
ncbi:prostaglandin E synthase 3 [Arvicanthis niloticus]|uniref:prostaglandin E synthase 3 n=1 Tax=Arvicanthis niloticus TaxID=61156 RepID=UPI00403CB63D